MLSDMWKKLQDYFKPYTLEEFIKDNDPVDHKDVERLESIWHRLNNTKRTMYF